MAQYNSSEIIDYVGYFKKMSESELFVALEKMPQVQEAFRVAVNRQRVKEFLRDNPDWEKVPLEWVLRALNL